MGGLIAGFANKVNKYFYFFLGRSKNRTVSGKYLGLIAPTLFGVEVPGDCAEQSRGGMEGFTTKGAKITGARKNLR